MRLVERAVGLVARFACGLGAVLTLLCVALVGYAVAMRYLLNQPEPWSDVVAGWLVVGVVMLASPEAQRRFEHIGVDVARNQFGPRMVRVVHLVGTVSVAVVAAVLLDAGIETVEFSRMVGMMTDLEGIPAWWMQSLLPIGAALLLLVSLCQTVLLLIGRSPAHLPEGHRDIPREPLARAE